MARKKRSELANVETRPAATDLTPEQEAASATWATHETDRFKCPLCRMWANTDNLASAPFTLETAIQRFGGSFPGYMEKGKNLVRRGYIQYFDEPPETTERLAAQMIPIVEQLLDTLREQAGDRAPEPFEPRNLIPAYQPPALSEVESEYDDDWEDLEPRGEELLQIEAKAQRQAERKVSAREQKQLEEARRLERNKKMIADRLQNREQRQITAREPQKQLPAGKEQKRITGKSDQKALLPPRE